MPCLFLCLWAGVQARAETKNLSVGDAAPDCEFIDQDGKVLSLHQFRGQALAITFIFTRCPLPAYCPRMTNNFRAVQQELASDKTTAADWHLLSLSFDPEHDTPEQLSAYSKTSRAEPSSWTFATAKEGVVKAFGSAFGLTAPLEDGLFNHNLRTVVLDRSGHVQHIFKGNEWTAKDLIWELRKAMVR